MATTKVDDMCQCFVCQGKSDLYIHNAGLALKLLKKKFEKADNSVNINSE